MLFDLKDILTIDFETYYDQTYSLASKDWNTSSYVRSKYFKVHCVGIKDGKEKTVWYPTEDVSKQLIRFGAKSRPVLAHNTAFDGFILAERYGIVPPYYLDTLSMGRGLHGTTSRLNLHALAQLYGLPGKTQGVLAKTRGIRNLDPELLGILGDYCCVDTDSCFQIAEKQLEVYPEKELDLIDWTIRVFCTSPLLVDLKLAFEEFDYEVNRKVQAIEQARTDTDVLQSADRLAEALRILGVEPPMKTSLKTGLATYAFAKTDADFKALLNHEDPDVVSLVEARLAVKSTAGETRAQRFIDIGKQTLPVGLTYCAAHTTRFGGANAMNLQNLKRGGRLRKCIIAPPGHVLVVRDSKQIECRTNAWFSDETWLLDVFEKYDAGIGPDPYKLQAMDSFSKRIEDITSEERFIGKTCVLGLGYQMGGPKLQTTLSLGVAGPAVFIELNQAYNLVNSYRRRHKMIVKNWDRMQKILVNMIMGQPGEYKCISWEDNTVWLPSGMPMHFNKLTGEYDATTDWFYNISYQNLGKKVHTYGGKLTENIIQALSRIAITDAQLEINDQYPIVMMTHDELVACVPKSQADACAELMHKVMSRPPLWAPTLVLSSEGGYSRHYSK